MNILNFGSLNIDRTYEVNEIVKEGETISSLKYQEFIGGKGLNQSIALAKAGAKVSHAGKIGDDGQELIDALKKAGVNVDYLLREKGASGHAIIQIDKKGRNSIIVEGRTNFKISEKDIDGILADFDSNTWLLIQNEISNLSYLIRKAKEKNMRIALNASPISEEILRLDFKLIDLLFINEIEGYQITKGETPEKIIEKLSQSYPELKVVLTLGEEGSIFYGSGKTFNQGAYKFDVIDTTGAGDTFTGYFLAQYVMDTPINKCLDFASLASGISVTRKGASNSIPTLQEVEQEHEKQNTIT